METELRLIEVFVSETTDIITIREELRTATSRFNIT